MRLNQEFNAESAAIAALARTSGDAAAEHLSISHRDSARLIDSLTRERFALIRVIERLPAGGDVAIKQRHITEAIARVQAEYRDGPSLDVTTATLVAPEASDENAIELARAHGYGVEKDDEWLVLTKGSTEIHLVMLPNTGTRTVSGESRIAQLAVYDRVAGRRLVFFDGEWVQACVDPVLQKELDSLLVALA